MSSPSMGYREVLQLAVMRRVWYAQLVSLLGDLVALFAVTSVATFDRDASASEVLGLQIASTLPPALLGPFAGVAVDRWSPKRTLVGSDLVRAALVSLLMTPRSMWQIYAVLASLSAVSSLFAPAQSVVIRHHVPPHGLLAANAVMQTGMLGVRIAGPLAAGALVATFGAASCYAVDAASFVASACLIASVPMARLPPARRAAGQPEGRCRALLRETADGMRFLAGHAALLFVVLALGAGLFTIGCFGPLIAIFVRESLRASQPTFALASAMLGVGLLTGIQVVRPIAARTADGTTILGGLAGVALALLLLAAVPHVAATLAATFLIGFAFAGVIVPAQTVMQRDTPGELMGRVAGAITSVSFLAQLLGLLVSGVASQVMSARAIFALCALVLGVAAAAGRRLSSAALPREAARVG